MFCSKCGAVSVGNYCPICGQKIRTPLADFRVQERRCKKSFISEMCPHDDLPALQLAEACWLAGTAKYLAPSSLICGHRVGELRPNAYANLEKAEALARRLYLSLCDLLRTD